MSEHRTVSWFSCGAASAVATKLALSEGGKVTIAYCEVAEEHPDNKRFLKDCEEWFGQEIIILGNDKYNRSIYEVFEKTRYLVGPAGARCTKELKKTVRLKFELPTDRQVFGYTVEEQRRADRFIDANAQVDVWPILIERGLKKSDCLAIIQDSGIELPEMYKLGYKNNNCMGCVKNCTPKYWKKIKIDFPEMFEKMNKIEQHLGRSVCQLDMKLVKNKYPEKYKELGSPDLFRENGTPNYWRLQLNEIPDDIEPLDDAPDIQCGIFCELAEQDIAGVKA
tara:strand:- start:30 stop:869 length:840 start_codon:yes stop_codon:yes gene_type:complete